jgi:hypothetical protein
VRIGFRWGSLRKRGHLDDPRIDGRIILKMRWAGNMARAGDNRDA